VQASRGLDSKEWEEWCCEVSHTYDVKSSEFSCQLMIYFFLSRSEGRGVLHAVHIDLQNRTEQSRAG
jgi:hypothetical protein